MSCLKINIKVTKLKNLSPIDYQRIIKQAQLPGKKGSVVNSEKGISVWRVWRPIEKVGLYIPGGKAVYPSSVLMSAIPAKIAGCKEIIMCTPARGKGQIPHILPPIYWIIRNSTGLIM